MCRGVVLAATSATWVIAAHGIGYGSMPDTVLTLLLAAGVAAVGIALAGKQYSLSRVVAVLGAAELAAFLLVSFDPDGIDMAALDDLAMIGAHATAVVVTALLLVGADAALFALVCAVRRLLPILVAPAPNASEVDRPRPTIASDCRFTAALLCRSNARRGPPVAA